MADLLAPTLCVPQVKGRAHVGRVPLPERAIGCTHLTDGFSGTPGRDGPLSLLGEAPDLIRGELASVGKQGEGPGARRVNTRASEGAPIDPIPHPSGLTQAPRSQSPDQVRFYWPGLIICFPQPFRAAGLLGPPHASRWRHARDPHMREDDDDGNTPRQFFHGDRIISKRQCLLHSSQAHLTSGFLECERLPGLILAAPNACLRRAGSVRPRRQNGKPGDELQSIGRRTSAVRSNFERTN